MSDAPTRPTSVPPPPTPAASPTRASTILGRLAAAVREQNWFAVVLEVVIVIVGVVIGFQVTAWGQARTDAAREQTYLRLLAKDMAATSSFLAFGDEWVHAHDRAVTELARAYLADPLPPRDSLLRWLTMTGESFGAQPVTGTADALVATGDLNLIRSDVLRSEITSFLRSIETAEALQSRSLAKWADARAEYTRLTDFSTWGGGETPPAFESDSRAASDYWPIPRGPRRALPPPNTESLVRTPAFHHTVQRLNNANQAMWTARDLMREAAQSLRQQIDAELNR